MTVRLPVCHILKTFIFFDMIFLYGYGKILKNVRIWMIFCMSKPKIFVSFDFEKDRQYKYTSMEHPA